MIKSMNKLIPVNMNLNCCHAYITYNTSLYGNLDLGKSAISRYGIEDKRNIKRKVSESVVISRELNIFCLSFSSLFELS